MTPRRMCRGSVKGLSFFILSKFRFRLVLDAWISVMFYFSLFSCGKALGRMMAPMLVRISVVCFLLTYVFLLLPFPSACFFRLPGSIHRTAEASKQR